MKKVAKKTLQTLALTGLLSLSGTALATKIGMINTVELFRNHPMFLKGEEDLKQIKQQSEEIFKEDMKALVEEYQQNLELLEEEQKEVTNNVKRKMKRPSLLAQDQKNLDLKKEKVEAEFKESKKKIEMAFQASQKKIENTKRLEILKSIQENTIAYAKENDYQAIFDSTSMLYIEAANDVTKEVLKQIKNNSKKK